MTPAQAPPSVRLGSHEVYYGWVIVVALSITETVTWRIIYYGFPVFLSPDGAGPGRLPRRDHGGLLDRPGRGGPRRAAGRPLDRPPRWARADDARLYEPAFAVVVSWFRPGRRDRALLTVTLAAGFALTIFMPIEAWLLERVGWRHALTILAVVLAVITIPIHALLLRRNPAATTVRAADGSTTSVPGMTLRQASRTLVFWVLAGAFFLSNFSTAVGPVGPPCCCSGWAPTRRCSGR